MPADLAETRRLEIGPAISRTLQGGRRNFTPLFAPALAVVGVPSLLASMPHFATDPQVDANARQLLVSVVSIPTTAILQASLTYATVADLTERRIGIGESLLNGLRAALPVIGASIV